MSKQAKLLQDALECLETGEMPDVSQEYLSVDEQRSFSLASQLRAANWPKQNHQKTEMQRKQAIAQYFKQGSTHSENRSHFKLFNNWRLPVILSSALIFFMACGAVTIIGLSSLWIGGQRVDMAQPPKIELTKQAAMDEDPKSADEIIESSADPNEIATTNGSLASDEALLTDIRGLVEIRTDEAWQVVFEDAILVAGTSLRTGSFSSASLSFKDGSLAQVGPTSHITIESLVADPVTNSRQITLIQLSGESNHEVMSLETETTSYQVDTPSARGQVKGTQFHVRVEPEQTVWMVDDGAVEVSGENEAVNVKAGEMTLVMVDEEPTHPVDYITGQGEVVSIGESWLIGDKTFQTHEQTIIIGSPQVGDLVFFEAHLLDDDSPVADLIVLVHRNPVNTFTMLGQVQVIGGTRWEVNGITIKVTPETEIEDDIAVGDLVRIKGVILGDGILQAEDIREITDEILTPFEFTGVVQEIGEQSWLISNIMVAVDANTELDQDLAEGDPVQVQGWIQKDGTWLASSISRFLDENSAFEFVGYIESMDPWFVSGIAIETWEWTAFDPGLESGDLVQVVGQIGPDGTWLAFEIRKYDETLLTVLVGRVFSMDPTWVVSGLELSVDENTIIEGQITLGMLVRVELQLMPDGTHKVVRIAPFDGFDWEMSCQSVVVTVKSIIGDQIILDGWPAMSLSEETEIVGELAPGSIIQTMICYDEDMNVVMVYIIVLDNPELPPPDDGDEGDDGKKVTVCHKPDKIANTIVIAPSAVPAHLAHGDILGSCP